MGSGSENAAVHGGGNPSASPPPPPPPPKSRIRERREDRDFERPPRREHYRSPSPPPRRYRDYKRGRPSPTPSPPPPRRYRRDEGGYDRRGYGNADRRSDRRGSPGVGYGDGDRRRGSPGVGYGNGDRRLDRRGSPGVGYGNGDRRSDRRGSPRAGYGNGDRRFYDDRPGSYDREMGGRHGYSDEMHNRNMGRQSGGFRGDWNSGHGGGGLANTRSKQREGLMSYKQFIQELEDDVLPSEAEHRYKEYRSEYISTQKKAYFDAHKAEEWLKDKYHPTNLVPVIERRNELARKQAKDFQLELQSGTLDLGPSVTASSSNKSGQLRDPKSDDEEGGKQRHHGRGSAREVDLSAAPKAHPVSLEPRRIQIDIEQAQALVQKLDSEKGIEDNLLCRSDNDRTGSDESNASGALIIIRGLTSVKGLEGSELLDTLLTYLWRIHGVDYYGMMETNKAKGFRHVRVDGKNSDGKVNGTEWEKKLNSHWQERLKGQDPLEIMTAKEKIDAAATEGLDPYVRKIRDEKYGWKYGCGAKGCTKLFHATGFVHKHLKLKHPELTTELTTKDCEDLYFQNYMNDENAPGGTPIMQQSSGKERSQRRGRVPDTIMKDERSRNRANGSERFNRSENPESGDDDDSMFDAFGGQGIHVAPFASDIPPPPVLMPVPGAGPLGPFVPAPPEVAMRMLREQGGPPPFEANEQNGMSGPQLGGPTPIFAMPPTFQDPRKLRSYQDLDAPEDEVTVIDYRSL